MTLIPDNYGSSPLARGLPTSAKKVWVARRIIPARAGFTASAAPSSEGRWDHPRSRGVYFTAPRSMPACQGSSPLARGLPGGDHGSYLRSGIIPARAGFTTGSRRPAARSRDHPRSRGVYSELTNWQTTKPGSSPLARGLPQTVPKLTDRSGIIPARAGFTDDRLLAAIAAKGSSPLARGLPRRLEHDRGPRGIIPARAGFTPARRSPAS